MENAARDLEPAPHPAREVPRDLAAALPEADLLQALLDPLATASGPRGRTSFPAPTGSRATVRFSSVVWACETVPIARRTADFSRTTSWPSIARRAGGRRQERREHADERRLAGSVRAEEPVDLARGDREGDLVVRDEVAELAGSAARPRWAAASSRLREVRCRLRRRRSGPRRPCRRSGLEAHGKGLEVAALEAPVLARRELRARLDRDDLRLEPSVRAAPAARPSRSCRRRRTESRSSGTSTRRNGASIWSVTIGWPGSTHSP